MKKRNFHFSLLILLVLTTLLASSFSVEAWKQVISQDGVEVSSIIERSTEDGIEKEYVILKIENTNATPVVVSWYLKTYYDGMCRSCDMNQPNEYNKKIRLAPGATLTGFSTKGPEQLRIFSGLPGRKNITGLSSFELADFKVEVE